MSPISKWIIGFIVVVIVACASAGVGGYHLGYGEGYEEQAHPEVTGVCAR